MRRSPLWGRWDRLLNVARIRPFLCQLCGHRFHAMGHVEISPTDERIERREYERILVRFGAAFSWEGGKGEGVVTDLSIAGCSLEVEPPVSEGDLLRLQVRAEENGPAISIDAAVVRYAGPWRVGLQFLRIQEGEKERLRAVLFRLYQERAARRAPRLNSPAGETARSLGSGPAHPEDS